MKRVNNDSVINKSQIQYAGADVRARRVHSGCGKMEKRRRAATAAQWIGVRFAQVAPKGRTQEIEK